MMPLNISAIAALLLLSAVFEGAEAAFLSISDVRVQTLVHKKDKRAMLVEKLKSRIRRLLGTLLLGQTVCEIAASAVATVTATKWFGDAGIGVATGVMTFIVLIFVNLIPKSYAAHNPEKWAFFLAPPAYALTIILGPVVSFIDRFSGLFIIRGAKERVVHVSEDEIKTMAIMGVKIGTVERGERELIERVFLFNDITAYDVMTPKENILSADGNKSIADVLAMMSASKFSRFPVYEKDENNITGIVHIKDIFDRIAEHPETALSDVKIKEIAAPASFVPKTKVIDDLFREFQKGHVHMAMVVNEFGTVVGLVTLDDLLEELVGEISDETDVDEHIIKRVDKYTVLVHGDIEVDHVNRFFNTKIAAPEHRTMSWLILNQLGRIPAEGEKILLADNLTASIEQVSGRRIMKVRLMKADEASGGER